jgi:hypothetical protein
MRQGRKFLLEFAPKTADELRAVMSYEHPENAHFRQVLSYWEMAADFAAREILHPEMFASHCGEGVLLYTKLLPFKDEIRATENPRFLLNLERAAAHPIVADRVKQMTEMLARMQAKIAAGMAMAPAAKKPAKKRGK